MKCERIDFDSPLIQAIQDDSLVIFAGAGVSIGSPSNLPDFKQLTDEVSRSCSRERDEKIPIDRFLGN